MASLLLRSMQVVKRSPSLSISAVRLAHAPSDLAAHELAKIGNREVVGYGYNGSPIYIDIADVPAPAIRFRPNDAPGIQALREKEKGDWHKLTKEEKKALYRASFCQTLVEVHAPTGFWKSIVGCTLTAAALAVWIMMGLKQFVYDPLPESLSLENRQAHLMRMLDIEVDPVDGLSSKYDYEKGTWK
ncbi:cytochrome c oxidase subunit 4 isoform 1, mitochondrial-like [Lycorma delicatula]|uniref:cytochrome c oxidase subunit 4 isoform 1, mitochondrial-like n=1 Tax=Lycorma delicatula TaxID=130591 RepID=UPI003F515BB2